MSTKVLVIIIVVVAVVLAAVVGAVVASAVTGGTAGTPTTVAVVTTAPPQATPTVTSPPTSSAPPQTTTTIAPDTLSEEELATAIDEAVAETDAAIVELTQAVEASTADGEVTEDEVTEVQVSLVATEEQLAYADSLSQAYADQYGEYAAESLATLEAIESDLDAIAEDTATMAAILEQGSAAATSAAAQLEQAAAAADEAAGHAQEQAQGWTAALDEARTKREQQVLAATPTEVPQDAAGALAGTRAYLASVEVALSDGRMTGVELTSLTQASANAVAGLGAQGGPLAAFASQVESLTTQLARGEVPQAMLALPALDGSVPALPPGGGVIKRR